MLVPEVASSRGDESEVLGAAAFTCQARNANQRPNIRLGVHEHSARDSGQENQPSLK